MSLNVIPIYTQTQPIQGSKCELACRDAKPHEKRWMSWCSTTRGKEKTKVLTLEEEKLYGEKYVWFIIAWYPDNWYKVKDNHHIRIVEQLEEALNGSV
ncbi:hypothetical protein RRG08_003978 [Elysia crispata]|uniref:Uncharacterized protein n=1 Tax=Elysia crispata TaxID=231223 RepID=A0AAE0XQY4_9GAST|nr:hypothetical protein RRG08_003978 [Elysia crispata]